MKGLIGGKHRGGSISTNRICPLDRSGDILLAGGCPVILTNEHMNQSILCIRRQAFHDLYGHRTGFISISEPDTRLFHGLFHGKNLWVGPRDYLESDTNFLQIIPYSILVNGHRCSIYYRTDDGNERRLHNKYSLGFGGHISIADVSHDEEEINFWATCWSAAKRELEEEVDFGSIHLARCAGLIYDPSNDVGKRHLGVVHVVHISKDQIVSREEQITQCSMMTVEELSSRDSNLESWSDILFRELVQTGKSWEKLDQRKPEDERT